MNFNQLEYFIESARCQSLNKAARNLFISQTALTKSLNSLEQELGFALLNRSRYGVSLTENGEKVYADVIKMIEIKNSWNQYRSSQDYLAYKDITIALTPSTFQSIITDIVGELSRINQYITIIPIETNSKDLCKVLSPSNIRFGIMFSHGKEDILSVHEAKKIGMEKTFLYCDKYCAFTSINHPLANKNEVTYEELKQHKIILPYQAAYINNPLYKAFPHISDIAAGGYSLYFNLAVMHQMIYLVPSIVCKYNIYAVTGKGKLLHITGLPDEYLKTEYWLFTPPENTLSKEERILKEFIIAFCRDLNQ